MMQQNGDPSRLSHSPLQLVDVNCSNLDHSIGHVLIEKSAAMSIIKAGVKLPSAWSDSGHPAICVRIHRRHNPVTETVVDDRNQFCMAQHNSIVPGLNKPRKSIAIEFAPNTEIVPELAPQPGQRTVFKHHCSPFDNTDLQQLLRNLCIDTLVICGVNTNNCVLCSCFEAFNRDYRVLLAEDVCASMNGPDYHNAAVRLIKSSLGWVAHCDAAIGALDALRAA